MIATKKAMIASHTMVPVFDKELETESLIDFIKGCKSSLYHENPSNDYKYSTYHPHNEIIFVFIVFYATLLHDISIVLELNSEA